MIDLVEKPTCQNCRFWRKVPGQLNTGECRRRAPVPLALIAGMKPSMTGGMEVANQVQPMFPMTVPDLWCGDHERAMQSLGSPRAEMERAN